MNHFFLFALCDIYLVVHMSDIIKQQIGCVILPVDSSLLSSFDQSSFVFSSLSYDDILPFSSLQCMYLPGLPNVGTKSPRIYSMTSHFRLRSLQLGGLAHLFPPFFYSGTLPFFCEHQKTDRRQTNTIIESGFLTQ